LRLLTRRGSLVRNQHRAPENQGLTQAAGRRVPLSGTTSAQHTRTRADKRRFRVRMRCVDEWGETRACQWAGEARSAEWAEVLAIQWAELVGWPGFTVTTWVTHDFGPVQERYLPEERQEREVAP